VRRSADLAECLTFEVPGILGNQTDLSITEHATDAAGATLANFTMFDLVIRQFSPRIRDLGKITAGGATHALRVAARLRAHV
jgi:TnpA family transposase